MADTKLSLLGVGVFDVNSLHLVYVIDGQDPDLKIKTRKMMVKKLYLKILFHAFNSINGSGSKVHVESSLNAWRGSDAMTPY